METSLNRRIILRTISRAYKLPLENGYSDATNLLEEYKNENENITENSSNLSKSYKQALRGD